MGVGAWAYTLLILIGGFALLISYQKMRTWYVLGFYFAVSGLTLFFDYLVYVWGKGYKYHPGFIDGNYDSHLGALANGCVLPAFAILYIALGLRWSWSVAMAVVFSAIEWLFTDWGIFKTTWWNPWITFVTLSFYFPACKLWWQRMTKTQHKWLTFFSLLTIFYGVFIPLNVFLYGILEIRSFHIEWIERLHRDGSAINTLTALVFGSMSAWFRTMEVEQMWYFLLTGLFIVYDLSLKYGDIVRTDRPGWDTALSFGTYFFSVMVVRLAGKKVI